MNTSNAGAKQRANDSDTITPRGRSALHLKSHTPECARIEQFAATLAPQKSYLICVQDFDTKDYTLEFQGRSIFITQQQFEDGAWRDIVRGAFPRNAEA